MAMPRASKISVTNTGEDVFLDCKAADSYETKIKKDLSNIITDLDNIGKIAKTLLQHKGTKGYWKDTAQNMYKKSTAYKAAAEKSRTGIQNKLSKDMKAYVLTFVDTVDDLQAKVDALEAALKELQSQPE